MPSRTHLLQKQFQLNQPSLGVMCVCCLTFRLVVRLHFFLFFSFLYFVLTSVGTDLKFVKFYFFVCNQNDILLDVLFHLLSLHVSYHAS